MTSAQYANGHDITDLGPDDAAFWEHHLARARDYQTQWRSNHEAPPEQPPALTFARDVAFDPRVTAPVKGVIELGDVGSMFGPSSVGKTFAMLHICMAIALGHSHWCGRRIKPGAVLYVAYEGGRNLQRRVLAARQRHGDPGALFENFHARTPLNRASGKQGVAAIIAATEALAAEAGTNVVLIVVDTLSAATAGDDENSAADMSLFVDRLKTIAAATGAAVCVIHHTGKDAARGPRGSAAIRGNLDFAIEIEDGGTMRINKSRDGAKGPLSSFDLEVIELGVDDDGDVATSCIVKLRDAPPEAPNAKKKSKLRPPAKKALEMLRRLYNDGSAIDVDPAEIDLKGVNPDSRPRVVRLDDWRKKCREARLAPTAATRTAEPTAFKRALEDLEGAEHITQYGDFVWLNGQQRREPKRSA